MIFCCEHASASMEPQATATTKGEASAAKAKVPAEADASSSKRLLDQQEAPGSTTKLKLRDTQDNHIKSHKLLSLRFSFDRKPCNDYPHSGQ